MNKIRPIAIYLPQFHPIPENDEWWGKGFTDWRNVVKAKPRFNGHYQPHLPADLGYYDLRIPEVREEQARLAQDYGIYGFCYYHYWFSGKRILGRPFQEVFESGKPEFPFMLCWANENWTRVWDGGGKNILLEQKYSESDDIAHIKSLIPYFKDERYIKINKKPVFVIYKDGLLPNVNETIKTFRNECLKENLEIYLCKFDRQVDTLDMSLDLGFDAGIEFQPLSKTKLKFSQRKVHLQNSHKKGLDKYLDYKMYFKYLLKHYHKLISNKDSYKLYRDEIISYKEFIKFDLENSTSNYNITVYPGVCPGWDNSARRPQTTATIFHGSTPALFNEWVKGKVEKFEPNSEEENFIFINAWNEWAEGNHLEPCEKWGHEYLKALKAGINLSDIF